MIPLPKAVQPGAPAMAVGDSRVRPTIEVARRSTAPGGEDVPPRRRSSTSRRRRCCATSESIPPRSIRAPTSSPTAASRPASSSSRASRTGGDFALTNVQRIDVRRAPLRLGRRLDEAADIHHARRPSPPRLDADPGRLARRVAPAADERPDRRRPRGARRTPASRSRSSDGTTPRREADGHRHRRGRAAGARHPRPDGRADPRRERRRPAHADRDRSHGPHPPHADRHHRRGARARSARCSASPAPTSLLLALYYDDLGYLQPRARALPRARRRRRATGGRPRPAGSSPAASRPPSPGPSSSDPALARPAAARGRAGAHHVADRRVEDDGYGARRPSHATTPRRRRGRPPCGARRHSSSVTPGGTVQRSYRKQCADAGVTRSGEVADIGPLSSPAGSKSSVRRRTRAARTPRAGGRRLRHNRAPDAGTPQRGRARGGRPDAGVVRTRQGRVEPTPTGDVRGWPTKPESPSSENSVFSASSMSGKRSSPSSTSSDCCTGCSRSHAS